jgi:alkylation response protein AidB-like acyl-CoA dehydrogenase
LDFRDTPEQATWRTEVRAFLQKEASSSLVAESQNMGEGGGRATAGAAMREWRNRLVAKGWIAPAWPKEYGGAGLGVMDQFVMNEEFAEARVANVGGMGTSMIGPTLIIHGNDEQKQEHLSAILRGEVRWCQGYSEPGAGSDLAALQTRAVRDGDDFVLNGQKIWTTGAHMSDWMFMLARTDPDAPKHRGITYFLMDMHSPGVTVRPLVNLAGGHIFNEVFFEDVRVPARNVVGEINRGWYIGTTTLDFERSSIGNAVGQRQTLEYYLRYIKEHRNDGTVSKSETVQSEFADRWIEAATAKMLSYRVITIQAEGRVPNHEASIAKLFNSELSQRIARSAMKAVGTYGQLTDREKAPMRGRAAERYMGSLSSTIAGGTSEVQRGIIATRGLGLPRG